MKVVITLIAALIACEPAYAALGGSESSLDRDQKAIRAVARRSAKPMGTHNIHEMVTSAGTVREFAAPDGTIFCVAWDGITTPPLSTLFGNFHSEYLVAARRMRATRGRGMNTVRTPNIIVQRSGIMRAARGKACVPSLIPQGVNINDIH